MICGDNCRMAEDDTPTSNVGATHRVVFEVSPAAMFGVTQYGMPYSTGRGSTRVTSSTAPQVCESATAQCRDTALLRSPLPIFRSLTGVSTFTTNHRKRGTTDREVAVAVDADCLQQVSLSETWYTVVADLTRTKLGDSAYLYDN